MAGWAAAAVHGELRHSRRVRTYGSICTETPVGRLEYDDSLFHLACTLLQNCRSLARSETK